MLLWNPQKSIIFWICIYIHILSIKFLTTIQNKDLLEELKVQSQAIVHKTITNGTSDGKQQMIRYVIRGNWIDVFNETINNIDFEMIFI
jgi:hypothetical protein